jgi:multiple antibiotic resistance protein
VTFFWEAFVTLFVIIDPPGIVPVFLGLTRGRSARTRRRLAWQAAIVAFGVIVGFALFGRAILTYTQVQLPALEGAGGLLLLLVSLQLLTGKTEEPTSSDRAKTNVAFVPLGTPLLAGPGAIVATMLYVQRVHSVLNGVALALAIVAVRGDPPGSHRQRRRVADQDRGPAAVRDRHPAGRPVRAGIRGPGALSNSNARRARTKRRHPLEWRLLRWAGMGGGG